MGQIFIMLEGAYSFMCHFPFVGADFGLHNPPSLHDSYCGNA
jgi:hypothetical protein